MKKLPNHDGADEEPLSDEEVAATYACADAVIRDLQERPEAYAAKGYDPVALLKDLRRMKTRSLRVRRQTERLENELLHLYADQAEHLHNLFKGMDKLTAYAEKQRPFDPEVQEWRENLEEWRGHFPKE